MKRQRVDGLSSLLPSTKSFSPFSLFVLSLTSAVVLSLTGLILNPSSFSNPEIVASNQVAFWERWFPSLDNHASQSEWKTGSIPALQTRFVAELIRARYGVDNADSIAATIVTESLRAKIDPLFVAAVIKAESGFRHSARSNRGALGLMQVMPDTARYISQVKKISWHGTWKLTDPEYNTRLGIEYIKYLKDQFRGNVEHALIAYNWGPSNLQQALAYRGHIPTSSVKYARSIIGNHRKWKEDFRDGMSL